MVALPDFVCMKTTVLGVRLNEFQREQLKKEAEKQGIGEADVVRLLVNMLIDGVIVL